MKFLWELLLAGCFRYGIDKMELELNDCFRVPIITATGVTVDQMDGWWTPRVDNGMKTCVDNANCVRASSVQYGRGSAFLVT